MKKYAESSVGFNRSNSNDINIQSASKKNLQIIFEQYSSSEDEDNSHNCANCRLKRETDLLIKIDASLFPVHRAVISQYSVILKNMIDTEIYDNIFFDENDEDEDLPGQSICIKNSQTADIKTLLEFIYNPEKGIVDSNVLTILRLAEEFQVSRLTDKCEKYLLKHRRHYHPLDLINISCEYNLNKVLDCAIRMASRIPGIECYRDFEMLNTTIKKQIHQRVLMISKYYQFTTNEEYFTNSTFKMVNCDDESDDVNEEYDADSEEGFANEDTNEDIYEDIQNSKSETTNKFRTSKTIQRSEKMLQKAFMHIIGMIKP